MSTEDIKKAIRAAGNRFKPVWRHDWETALGLISSDVHDERKRIALLIEKMGTLGYGAPSIAAAVRIGITISELNDIHGASPERDRPS